MLLLAACQADVAVDLDVQPDGSGTVRLAVSVDWEADQALGGLASQLRTSDLADAGWDLSVLQADDGSTLVIATKPVDGDDNWQPVLDEIAGPGVFRNVEVTRDAAFATAEQELTMQLDLREGWDLFSDDEVAAALDGQPFGAPIESLTDGRAIDDIVNVTVNVTVASSDDGAPAGQTYSPRFDDAEPTPVQVASLSENATAKLLRWIAIALFSLFMLATVLATTGIVLQRRADRLRPAPTPATLASRVPGAPPAAATTSAAAAPAARRAARSAAAPSDDQVRLVVIEPLSVLYQQSRVVDAHLLPFVRDQGGAARADTIVEGHRALVAGSSDTATFWELCGVDGDPDELDDAYVEQRSLRGGAADFLAEMQRRRIPVAAITNDATVWSERARDRDRLSAIWPWLISSTVGTTTAMASGAMFEVLRRESGVAYGHCLYVDTDIANLDAAESLGMKTVLFDTGDLDLPDVVGHPVVTDFRSLAVAKTS